MKTTTATSVPTPAETLAAIASSASNRLPVSASLRDALFLEGFTISGSGTETAFDYGALDMIVIRTDPSGQCCDCDR